MLILNGTSVGEVESFIVLGLQSTILANAQNYGVSDDPTMVAQIDALPKDGLTNNDNFDVPAEQVLAAKPDLVVSTWSGGFDGKSGFATRQQLSAAGINSLVNPDNCAFGKTDATAAEKAAYDKRSIDSSFTFLTLLGQIFDVPDRAAAAVGERRANIATVENAVKGKPTKKVLIAYPGMSMMNSNGLPAVFTGGIYDDIITAAGATDSFSHGSDEMTSSLNKEQLASADVDVLAVGSFTANEKPEQEAAQIFAAYPQWTASKNNAFVEVSDSVYFGPLNDLAVLRIAKAVHPDAGL